MMERLSLSFILILIFTQGCIKESYDLDKLSDSVQISPELVLPAFSGSVLFSDIVKNSDYIVSGEDELVRLVFGEDTTENFLADLFRNKMIRPEDITMLKLDIKALNGFPLEASLDMSLYDSEGGKIRSTAGFPDVLRAATVNEQGEVTGVTETYTAVEFSKDFLSSINTCDRIIFTFIFSTPGNETGMRMHSDYRIDFSSTVTLKAEIRLNK